MLTRRFCPASQSREAQGSFTFDRVFDMSCKQSDIFDYSIKPTVDDILNGYNGTVFAYGQTGAGKSYSECRIAAICLLLRLFMAAMNVSGARNHARDIPLP